MSNPVLYIIIPCYNEQEVLPVTGGLFLDKITSLADSGKISKESKILFVDDGSTDRTWDIITDYAKSDSHYKGVRLSRNRGHQNALLCGLMEAKDFCDITISIDCDGQDDINAMDEMVEAYEEGCQVVYGVRDNRDTDSFFKRTTARGFYRLMNAMGAQTVYDHADYRLISAKVLGELARYEETNLFLRGLVPLVGFKDKCVYYKRENRMAGKSHYPLGKMIHLAFEGITSFSVKPIRMIIIMGICFVLASILGIIWAIYETSVGNTVPGWSSTVCIVLFVGGVQVFSLGVIGEYIGKIYMETKRRPRYCVSERTGE